MYIILSQYLFSSVYSVHVHNIVTVIVLYNSVHSVHVHNIVTVIIL